MLGALEDDTVRARVFIRWVESVSDEDRQKGELRYGLPTAVQRVGRTWTYRVDNQFDLDHVSADSRVERAQSVKGSAFAAVGLLERIRTLLNTLLPRRMDAFQIGQESAFHSAWLRVVTLVNTTCLALVSILRSGLTRVGVLGFLVVAGLSCLFVDRRRMSWRPEDVVLVASLTLCLAALLGSMIADSVGWTAGAAAPGMVVAGAWLVSRFSVNRHHSGRS